MRPYGAGAVLTVDLSAIQANWRVMRSLVPAPCEIAAVVKCDAYGLGLVRVARALADVGCRTFFVANLAEGLALRHVLRDIIIVVLHDDIIGRADVYRSSNLTPVANNDDEVRHILASPPSKYVLKLDTGFSRFGVSLEAFRELCGSGFLGRHPPILLMSHLACSDRAADPNNHRQRGRLESVRHLLPPIPISLAASAGVWLGTDFHYDQVRIGSALFGLNNASITPNPLSPVTRLSAPIVDVRELPPGEIVGYAGAFRSARPTRVAILGIGYSHGLPWSAANRIFAHCGSVQAPLIGRVSMEYCALDVTDVPAGHCVPGANATLLDAEFDADNVAGRIGISAQELIVRLGEGCRRRYIPEARAAVAIASTKVRKPPPRSHPLRVREQ